MSGSARSPLPWRPDATGEVVRDADGALVADCGARPGTHAALARANAALVAAAGELETQLRAAVAMMRLVASAFDLDPGMTVFQLRANGQDIAEVSLAQMQANAQAALDAAEGR